MKSKNSKTKYVYNSYGLKEYIVVNELNNKFIGYFSEDKNTKRRIIFKDIVFDKPEEAQINYLLTAETKFNEKILNLQKSIEIEKRHFDELKITHQYDIFKEKYAQYFI